MKFRRIYVDAMLLYLGTATLPIYAFGSGGIQPAHAILAVFALLTLTRRGIPLTGWSIFLLAVFLHSLLMETLYVFVGGNLQFMINCLFFLYNFILVCAVYRYVSINGLSIIVPGIITAAGIALITILVSGVDLRELGDSGRSTGTFNNPNQLGYFSVCLLSISYLFYRSGNIGYWIASALFGTSLFLAISSLSKAAMISNFIVIALVLKPVSSRKALWAWFTIASIAFFTLIVFFQRGVFDEYLFVERLLNITNENDSSLESRGYFAFLEGNTLQLIFGLGAQGVDYIVGHEVHSTFGSVINNYGLFGFVLFFGACAMWAFRLWHHYGFIGLVCLAAPAMLYGVTHNGTRFTIFWLLFAASLGMVQRSTVSKNTRIVSEAASTAFKSTTSPQRYA
jgi:hypothetical protein